MTALNNIIVSLGINTSLWLQFGIFTVTFFALKALVIRPYFRAFEGRQNRTTGSQEKAEQIFAQTRELETLYQRKMRGLNADLKSIYDKARLEAHREQERIQAEAKEKARARIDQARERVQLEVNKAREELIKQMPEIGRTITDRLISSGARR